MRTSYDYFTAPDGRPGNTMVGTRWVDPTVRMGHLVAELTGTSWTPALVGLSRISPFPDPRDPDWSLAPSVSALDDKVRDALARVEPERIEALGAWWIALDADRAAARSAAEAAAVLRALVGLCRDAVEQDHHLYVASGF